MLGIPDQHIHVRRCGCLNGPWNHRTSGRIVTVLSHYTRPDSLVSVSPHQRRKRHNIILSIVSICSIYIGVSSLHPGQADDLQSKRKRYDERRNGWETDCKIVEGAGRVIHCIHKPNSEARPPNLVINTSFPYSNSPQY